MLVSGGGGGWLGGDGFVVLICSPEGAASLDIALWGLGLRLLDGWCGPDVLSCL